MTQQKLAPAINAAMVNRYKQNGLIQGTSAIPTSSRRSLKDCRIHPKMAGMGVSRPPHIYWRHPFDSGFERELIKPGENILIYGPPKSRKSFLLNIMVTPHFYNDPFTNMGFGVNLPPASPDSKPWAVVWFDTEQSDDRVYECSRRFYKWCNADPDLGFPNFFVYYLRGMGYQDKRESFLEALEEVSKDYNILLTVTDQIVDFTNGTDDTSQAEEVMTMFQYANVTYGTSIAATMHSNRMGKETNGKAGSYWDKKFECTLRTELQEDFTSKMVPRNLRRGLPNFDLIFAQNEDDPVLIKANTYEMSYKPMSSTAPPAPKNNTGFTATNNPFSF